MVFNASKNAWLDSKDTGSHAWWNHKATPGHNAISSALQSGAVVSRVCGYGAGRCRRSCQRERARVSLPYGSVPVPPREPGIRAL